MKQENTSARLFDGFSKWDVLNYVILGVLALLCLAPVINIVAISFSSASVAEAGLVSFWPRNPTFASYERILEDRIFFGTVIVSLLRVVIGTSLSLLLLFLMAYPLSLEKEEFSKRNWYMWFVIFTMLFNGGMIPTYLLVTKLKLTNTIWALILPYLTNAYNTILMMNYFRGLPRELREAASIDGAGPMKTLWAIYAPLAKPVTATLALFCLLYFWNDYFAGLIYINKAEDYPLMTYIHSLTLSMDFSSLTGEELVKRAAVGSMTYSSAKIVVAMVPILVIYPFLQKYFVRGITLGAVKG